MFILTVCDIADCILNMHEPALIFPTSVLIRTDGHHEEFCTDGEPIKGLGKTKVDVFEKYCPADVVVIVNEVVAVSCIQQINVPSGYLV